MGRAAVMLLVACLLPTAAGPAVGDGCCGVTFQQPEANPPCNFEIVELPVPAPVYVLCNGSTEGESTIKVEIVTTGTSETEGNGWGGVIGGIYYRESAGHDWGPNMVNNQDPGGDVQVSVEEGPPSRYWSRAGGRFAWQGGYIEDATDDWILTPAWITGAGNGWLSIRTPLLCDVDVYPDYDCMQVDQTVWVRDEYIEVEYSVSERSLHSCQEPGHALMFQESPVIFAWPGESYDDENDPYRLKVAKLYDGPFPWQCGAVNENVEKPAGYPGCYSQVYPSEDWIGLFRDQPNEEEAYGLTLAYARRPRHQPYPHMWAFYQDPCLEGMWLRHFFDVVHGSGETISWTVYIIPGTVAQGRRMAYNLLPHPRWGFDCGNSSCRPLDAAEGWTRIGRGPGAQPWPPLMVQSDEFGGKLVFGSTTGPPVIESLDQLDFAGDYYRGVKIDLTVSAGNEGRISFRTEEDPIWTTEKSQTFPVQAGIRVTRWVRLDTRPGWLGSTIRQLRVQPTNAPTGSSGIQIYSIELVRPIHFEAEPRYSVRWEFNAADNNEGWTPVSTQLEDPALSGVWPSGNVAGGKLKLTSKGIDLDEYTHPDTPIYPSLLGPYHPNLVPRPGSVLIPSGGGGWYQCVARLAYISIRFPDAQPGDGNYTLRLRYTLSHPTTPGYNDDKVFDYHPYPRDCDPGNRQVDDPADCVCSPKYVPWPEDVFVGEEWEYNRTITRFDLGDFRVYDPDRVAVFPTITNPDPDTWYTRQFYFPDAHDNRDIDQLLLELVEAPEAEREVHINYIRIGYQ